MIERKEFGSVSNNFAVLIGVIILSLSISILCDLSKTVKQRQEYLKHFTKRGERLTFGKGNRYETEFAKKQTY